MPRPAIESHHLRLGALVAAFSALAVSSCDTAVEIGEWPARDPAGQLARDTSCVRATPDRLELADIQIGATGSAVTTIINDCGVPVRLDRFSLSGDEGFAFTAGGALSRWTGATASGAEMESDLAPPVSIAPGGRADIVIRYEAPDRAPARAVLDLHGAKPDQRARVSLVANAHGPCLTVSARPDLDFGCQLEGSTTRRTVTLRSCAARPFTLDVPHLSEGSAAAFAIDAPEPGAQRWTLDPGADVSFDLVFSPPVAPAADQLTIAWQEGTLVVPSAALDTATRLPVRGFSKKKNCEALTIELAWSTPGDPDSHDTGEEAGADLDLHLRHPLAAVWYDVPFDAYWFNATPSWGDHSRDDDDPRLEGDVHDGSRPERLSIRLPEDGAVYRIAAHYWNDHGFGLSEAVVRVYLFGQQVWESEPVELAEGDLWEAATVSWPGGDVRGLGGPAVTPLFAAPCRPGSCKGK